MARSVYRFVGAEGGGSGFPSTFPTSRILTVTLRSAISTPEGKRRYVRRLFATIADRYDFITGFLSYGQDRRWKRQAIALAQLQSRDRVLDLACGTGDLLFGAAGAARIAASQVPGPAIHQWQGTNPRSAA